MRWMATVAVMCATAACDSDPGVATDPAGVADSTVPDTAGADTADASARTSDGTDVGGVADAPVEDAPPQDAGGAGGPDAAPDVGPDAVGLPPGVAAPPVPGNGWANAVIASQIAPSVEVDGAAQPNVAANTAKVLGPPEGTLAGVLALGLVGDYVVVDLGEGEEATDGDGADLVVLEYGAEAGGVSEPYRVSVAVSPDGPFVPVGEGAGPRGFDLAGTGVASARYVRVESRATLADVAGGPGSPLYPGPEIDAIGAVFPGGATPPASAPVLALENLYVTDQNQDEAWQTGEFLNVHVELVNQGTEDYLWYPGVAVRAVAGDAEVAPEPFWFYAILVGQRLDADLVIAPPDGFPAGPVTIEARVVALNCVDTPGPCPPPGSVSVSAVYGAAACCTIEGACSNASQAACQLVPGMHSWNPEQSCNTIQCPNETQGACCNDGECTIATSDACGPGFMGKDTTCDQVTCPVP